MPLKDYEEIVDHFDAPTLVLAGPGAGKTYLLADRIKRLLNSGVTVLLSDMPSVKMSIGKLLREKLNVSYR